LDHHDDGPMTVVHSRLKVAAADFLFNRFPAATLYVVTFLTEHAARRA
jgi:hypothetical protein